MNLNTSSWKEFNLSRTKEQPGLFIIENCKCSCAEDLEDGYDINYIGAKKNDNGVMRSVKIVPELVTKGNGILFICDGQGSVGYTNYMLEDFIGSTTTAIGYDSELNELRGMFLVSILDRERFKYSFGRKYKRNLPKAKISLPIKRNEDGTPKLDSSHKYSSEGYVPDWNFMENFIKTLHYKPLTTKNKKGNVSKLSVSDWQIFKLEQLFTVNGSKTTPKEFLEEQGKGIYPYITTSAQNNGVSGYYNYWTENGNVLTVESACMGFATYQEIPFSASDHVEILNPNFKLDRYIGMFLVTLINNENYKFSYGRKCNQTKIKNMCISLPIQRNEDGTPKLDSSHKYSSEGYVPDWNLMSNYIKSLPYGDRLFVETSRTEQNRTEQNRTEQNRFHLAIIPHFEDGYFWIEVKYELRQDTWKDFKISSLFEISRGKRLTEEDREDGDLEYYSASESNNGLTDHISNPLFVEENALIYTTFGDCYYVPCEFTASDEISIWKYKEINVYNAMFIATIVNKSKYKYAFGRKAFKNKYANETIKLPTCYELDGKTPVYDKSCKYSEEGYIPNFEFMENYIKSLPYGDKI